MALVPKEGILQDYVDGNQTWVQTQTNRGVSVDFDLDCDAVVLDPSILRVQDLVPVHGEARAIILAAERAVELEGVILPAPLVDQADVYGGPAWPVERRPAPWCPCSLHSS